MPNGRPTIKDSNKGSEILIAEKTEDHCTFKKISDRPKLAAAFV